MKTLKMKNPPHPGFSVRVDCLEAHGLSVTDSAKILGVSRSALSHLVNESADLSWDMAIRLAKAFGSTPEGWMRLQFQFDAAQVEARSKKIKVKTFVTNPVHA
jgi:antitoxin HigA-1